jgi:signal transduction histidine kinase
MPGSLRLRLPAVFLLGIVLAGVVSALIAVQLFSGYTRNQSYEELGREARGIARLYSDAALRAIDEGAPPPDFAPGALELATGDQLFYVGAPAFPGQYSGLDRLPESSVPGAVLSSNAPLRFQFRPPGATHTYLAASQPLRLEKDGPVLGAIVVAKAQDVVRDQWLPLVARLAAAFTIGAATEERERQFLMSVSHELRTPLTAIRGHVDALRDGLIDDPELIGASLDVVANEATRLERLVGDVLDLAKLRAHRFTVQTEEVDMGRLVEQAYGAFGDEARRRAIDYELRGAAAAPTIITDGDRVFQVITNLLKNAFRWTPDGGSIDVVLESANGALRVDVVDTGPGISPEDVRQIFSPFVSRDTQGTGLGLPIAQELAGALGGRVELETEPGQGSRFRLVLPVRRA